MMSFERTMLIIKGDTHRKRRPAIEVGNGSRKKMDRSSSGFTCAATCMMRRRSRITKPHTIFPSLALRRGARGTRRHPRSFSTFQRTEQPLFRLRSSPFSSLLFVKGDVFTLLLTTETPGKRSEDTRGGWRDPDTNHSCYCWHVFVPGIGVYGLTATCSGFCVIARSTLECEIHRGT